MLGELLGAGVSLIGGLMGSSAEKKAAKENRAIAEMNLQWERERFKQMMDYALRLEEEGKLGQTDIRGNTVKYVPGKGWVSTPGTMDALLQELYHGEETRRMGQDVPAGRAKMFENLDLQRGERGYADALMAEMHRTRRQRPEEVMGQRNLMAAEGLSEGTRPAIETATRNAIRTGNSAGAADIARRIGVGQGEALRKAFMENRLGARAEAEGGYDSRIGNLANLYNQMATRATALPADRFDPRNIQGPKGAEAAGQQAQANVLNAYGQPVPKLDYKAPTQYGMANTLASLGSSIGNMDFSGMSFGGNYGSNSSSNNYSSNLFPSAPSTNKYQEGKGLW